jgi:hypothetical protein
MHNIVFVERLDPNKDGRTGGWLREIEYYAESKKLGYTKTEYLVRPQSTHIIMSWQPTVMLN